MVAVMGGIDCAAFDGEVDLEDVVGFSFAVPCEIPGALEVSCAIEDAVALEVVIEFSVELEYLYEVAVEVGVEVGVDFAIVLEVPLDLAEKDGDFETNEGKSSIPRVGLPPSVL